MTIFSATVLVSKSDGIGSSLVLRCTAPNSDDGKDYCFNLPESLARLASSYGKDLRNVAAAFVPTVDFDCLGGYPSFCLHAFKHRRTDGRVIVGPQGFEKCLLGFGRLGSRPLKDAVSLRVLSPNYNKNCYEDSLVAVCGLSAGGSSFAPPPPDWMIQSQNMEAIDLVSESDSDDDNDDDDDGETTMTLTVPTGKKGSKRIIEDTIVLSSEDEAETTPVSPTERKNVLPHVHRRKLQKKVHSQRDASSYVLVISDKDPVPKQEDTLNDKPGRIDCFVVYLKETKELVVVIMVYDIASLDQLKRHPHWGYIRYPKRVIKAVFHLSAPELMATAKYKRWAASLSGEQIFVDSTIGEGTGLDVGFSKVLDRGIRLRAVMEKHFPLPVSFANPPNRNGIVFPENEDGLPSESMTAYLLTQIRYEARGERLQKIASPIDSVNPDMMISATLRQNARAREMVRENEQRCLNLPCPWDVFHSFFEGGQMESRHPACAAQDRWQSVLCQANELYRQGGIPSGLFSLVKDNDPSSLLFLGTGCAEPSAWRGASAILIRTGREQKGILLDCGEGTYGQLCRYLGPEEAKQTVNRLECIWISHRHTDHCTGIGALLSKRDQGLPLVVVFCPKEIRSFLQAVDIHCHCVNNAEMVYESFEDLRTSLGIHHWISFRVEHSVPSFGLRIDWKSGFSLVYSGDTSPCEELVRHAVDCTLLIHESTHSCNDGNRAKETRHSTWGQALDVASRTRAYRTILTHFSRLYPGLPNGLTAHQLGHNASVAFDGMFVRFTDLTFLPSYNRAMEEVLQEIEFGGDLVSSDDEEVIDLLSEASSDGDIEDAVTQSVRCLKLEN